MGSLTRFCSILVIAMVACPAADASRQAVDRDPWSSLQHKTGWILLGAVDAESHSWVTTVHHVIRKASTPSGFPAPTDLIELTRDHELVILDYQMSGEQRRLASPAGTVMEKRHLTEVILPPTSRVVVREVRRDPATYGPQGVWVRVTPETDR